MNISGETLSVVVSLIIGSGITVIVQLVLKSMASHRDQGLKLIRKEEIESVLKEYMEEKKTDRKEEISNIVNACTKELTMRVNDICKDIRALALRERGDVNGGR